MGVDLFDPAGVADSVAGHDAIVNLATKIPDPARFLLPGAWHENDRIRREASRNLVEGALRSGCGHYLQESLAFMYADAGDRWIDEDEPPSPAPYAATVLDGEANAQRFADAGGSGVILRFGQFYAPDSIHTQTMVRVARRGLSPFVGRSDGDAPLIHADDVATAVVCALAAPSGIYNVVDDEPLTRRELGDVLARAVGRRRLIAPPAPGISRSKKLGMLARSQRLSNRHFRHASGWAPRYPSAREGLPAVAAEILT